MPIGSPQWMYASGEDAFTIDQSLRFNAPDSPYLSKSFGSDGNRKTFSISCWLKRGKFGSSTGNTSGNYNILEVRGGTSGDQICIRDSDDSSAIQIYLVDGTYILNTDQLFRDPSAWYHLLLAVDTTQGTESNRVKFYINGSQVTSFSSASYPTQNLDMNFNASSGTHYIGRQGQSTLEYWDGYMAEFHWVDGTAELPSAFGETGDYGEWKPIEVSGLTYGTNGFYLDFADSGALGDDESGNTNDWTVTNLAATDQVVDSPTNNFCTLNPLDEGGSNTVAEGNLQYTKDGANFGPMRGTLGVTTGKWYFEAMRNSDSDLCQVGVSNNYDIHQSSGDNTMGNTGGIGAAWDSRGYYYRTGGNDSGKTTYTTNEIVSVAFDADTGKIWWRKSGGSWEDSGNPVTGANPSYTASSYSELMPFVGGEDGGGVVANFGQDSSFAGNKTAQGNQDSNDIGDFYYEPPSGYLALCTSNLPDVAVTPSEHFNTILWTGDDTDDRSITGVGFQPDWTWNKRRNHTASHMSYDAVRGATKNLLVDVNNAENTEANAVQAFESDGFQVGDDANSNSSSYNFVAWNWKANGSGSANTAGDINSTVSVNTDAGFSIVGYTGNGGSNQTVGHGLSSTPDMVILKGRTDAGAWYVGHIGLSTNEALELDTNSAKFNVTTGQAGGGLGARGATTFTLADGTVSASNVNRSGNTYIAYCFHSVDGYSKVGSYTGNGDADGTFVYTGFRPAWIMLKVISHSGERWELFDTARSTINPSNHRLSPNENSAEVTGYNSPDILSNGFKFRGAAGYTNDSGKTYIYLAFAETPFKYSNAR